MRVIAGKYRGIRLQSPPDVRVRPTTDRVKETMFGSIQFEVPGAKVLDLFAGSGALGIEAASRGAEQVVLVERDAAAIGVIRSNMARVKDPPELQLVKNDYASAMKLFQNTVKFDIVFIDPPYSSGVYTDVLQKLVTLELLAEDAILVLESDEELEIDANGIELWKRKRMGSTHLLFCRHRGAV